MLNRRRFLAGVVAAGVTLGLSPRLRSHESGAGLASPHNGPYSIPAWINENADAQTEWISPEWLNHHHVEWRFYVED